MHFSDKNIKKLGNNGKLWIIRNGKWNEINKDILTAKADDMCKINITVDFTKINSKQKTFLHKLSFIGQYNNHGIFVKAVTFKKKYIFILDLITTVDNGV